VRVAVVLGRLVAVAQTLKPMAAMPLVVTAATASPRRSLGQASPARAAAVGGQPVTAPAVALVVRVAAVPVHLTPLRVVMDHPILALAVVAVLVTLAWQTALQAPEAQVL
jgi:hypothetical protein